MPFQCPGRQHDRRLMAYWTQIPGVNHTSSVSSLHALHFRHQLVNREFRVVETDVTTITLEALDF